MKKKLYGTFETWCNSRKSVRWSVVPVPYLSRLCLKLKGEQGSGPKGVNNLCFDTYGEFSPPPPSGIGPFSWDLDLKAGIWSSRLRYGPGGWGRGIEEEEKIPLYENIGH